MRAVLALDQGSHASRAVVFDAAGCECATAEVAVATVRRGDDEVEHDAEELLASMHAAASRALRAAAAADPGLELAATGLATQRSTFLCCERGTLRPLTPAISWQDRRNASWLESLRAQEPRVRALTGLPLSAHYGASKIRWCLDHVPAVRAAAAQGTLQVLPLAAWLVGRLTGHPMVDPANAARTLLWDSAALAWSAELCTLFGIEADWLPPCGPTRGAYGHVDIEGVSIPLRACTGDQSAVPYAAGRPDPFTAYVNLGTGAFIQRPLAQRPLAPEPLLGSILCVDEHGPLYSLEGSVNGAGAAVAWFAGAAGVPEATLWPRFEALPGSIEPPLFLNGVGGLGSPWWRAQFPSRFVGEGDADARFAAVVESIAFLIAENLERMVGPRESLRRIVLTGGLSRSDGLCRRVATLLGARVERGLPEATARGTAALAAPDLARGWSHDGVRAFAPGEDARLIARRSRWREAMRAALDRTVL